VYSPQFKITNKILKNIGLVEACREVIDNAPLIPYWEKKFREEAIQRTVHYGTHLEGNELSFQEAVRVMEGEKVVARSRDIQEVINYRRVMKYLEGVKDPPSLKLRRAEQENKKAGGGEYSEEQLKKIHHLTCSRLISRKDQGQYRRSQVVLKNSQTGEIAFRPPPAVEVPYLVKDFFVWLNSPEARETHPVLRAGIAHYALVAIHPFVEGNGRTARAFATLILFLEGFDIKRFFSLEENFDRDSVSYFGALLATSSQNPDLAKRELTAWLEYFTQVLAIELNRIKERVRQLSVDSKLKKRIGKQIALSERQMKLVEYLEENREMTTPEAREILSMVSDDTILRDLKDLVKKGIVRKEGRTKAARYIMK
jgi:Fic family protein